jgi:hypothetical protein
VFVLQPPGFSQARRAETCREKRKLAATVAIGLKRNPKDMEAGPGRGAGVHMWLANAALF